MRLGIINVNRLRQWEFEPNKGQIGDWTWKTVTSENSIFNGMTRYDFIFTDKQGKSFVKPCFWPRDEIITTGSIRFVAEYFVREKRIEQTQHVELQ